MAISEHSRHQLYNRLEELLGGEEAATLMAHLPPVGWADVATKRDVDMLAIELRGEMASLRAEVRGEIAALRGEFGELRGEFGALRAEVSGLKSEWRGELQSQMRTQLVQLLGIQIAAAGVFASIVRLF
ncbi:MAG TPA: hypothetical protein VM345_02580 [Acidimicrobiales bacterium]|jgi:hypothetical protein|nr:hypothetical protein [Acidimicrobiales bacterium]